MPWLTPKGGGEPQFVPEESLQKAISSGLYLPPEAGTKVGLVDPVTGLATEVDAAELGRAQEATGFRTETEAERRAGERTARLEEEHGGIGGQLLTGVEQVIDTATFGGFGTVAEAVAGEGYTESRAERLEVNEEGGLVGTGVGAVLPGVLSGGSGAAGAIARATPAGAAARLGEGIAAAGRARGAIAGTATAAAGYGVEGALFGAGHVLSETILQDKELSGEAFVAGMQEGGLWGAGAGGVGALLSRGTKAAKSKLDKVLDERKSAAQLETDLKAAKKEYERQQKLADKLMLQRDRQLNQRGMEELRQKGRLDLVEARGEARKEAVEFTAEQKLKLEEYRQAGKKELAEIGSEARLRVEQERAAARLGVADKKLDAELAKAEAKAAMARAKVEEVSERLAVEQERTARAQLVMEGRLQLADTYTSGWRRAADSREAVAASKLEAASIGADARIRTGMADALAKTGREEAGMLIEELIPARMRTPKAVDAAKAEALTHAARLQATTDDLVRQADEIMQLNPAAADELAVMRQRAAEAAPEVTAWSERAGTGADDFASGFRSLRNAEEAQHDLAQALAPHLDDVGRAQLQQVTGGMEEALRRTDDIVVDSIAKRAEAASGGQRPAAPGGAGEGLAYADLLAGVGGMPNSDDIPVIGPVLGAYLKFRAAQGALGKLGIRLPGPVARIAQVSSGLQDKASQAVSYIVQSAPRTAQAVERAAPSLSSSLSRPLWEPAEPKETTGDKKPSPQQLYQRRVDELERAVADVASTRRQIADAIPAPPALAAAIADTEVRKLEYLASQLPRDPRAPTVNRRPYVPSPVEIQRLAEQKRALEDPVGAFLDWMDGLVSPAAVDAVKAVFPRLFRQLRDEFVEQVAESAKPLPYERLVRAVSVFEVPLDTTLTPEYVAARQAEYAAPPAPPAQMPAGGPQIRLSEQEQLGSLRRAMR